MAAKDDYDRFHSIAEELKLEDSEREDFVSGAMKRKGYTPSMTWNDPEPEKPESGGDFFSQKRQEKKSEVKEQPKQGNQGWQYGS